MHREINFVCYYLLQYSHSLLVIANDIDKSTQRIMVCKWTLMMSFLFFLSYLVPSAITNIIAINQYVIWQPPTEKNGIITGYVMKVCRGELCKVLALGPSQFVYEVQVSDIPSGTSIANVQVSIDSMLMLCSYY